MSLFPGLLVPWLEQRFFDANGVPLALGTVECYIAGTSTPKVTYSDADLTTPNPTTITLDSGGRPTVPLFLANDEGYKFKVFDSASVLQYTLDDIESANVFAETFGNVLSTGIQNVTSGYTVLTSDRLVTVSSSGGPTPCIVNLPAVSGASQLLTIKNLGSIALAVTPNGTDLVDNANTAYTVAAVSGQLCPSLMLAPDPSTQTWWILASHG